LWDEAPKAVRSYGREAIARIFSDNLHIAFLRWSYIGMDLIVAKQKMMEQVHADLEATEGYRRVTTAMMEEMGSMEWPAVDTSEMEERIETAMPRGGYTEARIGGPPPLGRLEESEVTYKLSSLPSEEILEMSPYDTDMAMTRASMSKAGYKDVYGETALTLRSLMGDTMQTWIETKDDKSRGGSHAFDGMIERGNVASKPPTPDKIKTPPKLVNPLPAFKNMLIDRSPDFSGWDGVHATPGLTSSALFYGGAQRGSFLLDKAPPEGLAIPLRPGMTPEKDTSIEEGTEKESSGDEEESVNSLMSPIGSKSQMITGEKKKKEKKKKKKKKEKEKIIEENKKDRTMLAQIREAQGGGVGWYTEKQRVGWEKGLEKDTASMEARKEVELQMLATQALGFRKLMDGDSFMSKTNADLKYEGMVAGIRRAEVLEERSKATIARMRSHVAKTLPRPSWIPKGAKSMCSMMRRAVDDTDTYMGRKRRRHKDAGRMRASSSLQ